MDLGTLVIVAGVVWLIFALAHPRPAVWLLLLWLPVQGWIQLNIFNDSSATVLLYEYQVLGLYAVFALHAMRSREPLGPPPLMRMAVPFVAWILLLVPFSINSNGLLLTLLGLRTYLVPLGLVWIGYRAFDHRRQLETLSWTLMLQIALIGAVAVQQMTSLSSAGGTVFEIPTGYGVAMVLRPPGTFSSAGHMGMYLLFGIPVAIGLLGLKVEYWKRACFVIGLGGAVIGLVANTQRATMVLLVVAIPVMLMIARRRDALVRLTIAVGVIAASVAVGSQFGGAAFQLRMNSITADLHTTVVVNPTDRMIDALESPVYGGGLGIASPGAVRLEPAPGLSTAAPTRTSIKPAESFMAALVYQSGIPGLLLFYLFLGTLLVHGWRAAHRCRGTDLGLLAGAIVAFQVTILIQSWAYDPLHYPPSRVLFWLWSGVLLNLPALASAPAVRAWPAAHRAAATAGGFRPSVVWRPASPPTVRPGVARHVRPR